MITLHRLGHAELELHINPDLIVQIEANPDTVITLANGCKLVVAEAPAEVAAEVKAYRVEILADALRLRNEGASNAPAVPLHLATSEPRL
jgi:uncharacterized protein YlzI (FlbEa/FlbD family)